MGQFIKNIIDNCKKKIDFSQAMMYNLDRRGFDALRNALRNAIYGFE